MNSLLADIVNSENCCEFYIDNCLKEWNFHHLWTIVLNNRNFYKFFALLKIVRNNRNFCELFSLLSIVLNDKNVYEIATILLFVLKQVFEILLLTLIFLSLY